MGRLVKKTASAAVAADGSMRLAVVADTHSQPHPATGVRLAELAPNAILHAGDVGDPAVLDDLAKVAPVYAVRGNIDTRAPDLPDVLVLTVAAPVPFRILVTHIALHGARLTAPIVRMAQAEGATLIVCGHTHVPFIGKDRGLTVFNPGSIGPRRFSLPILLGRIDLTSAGVTLAHIDAPSGRIWLPPQAGHQSCPPSPQVSSSAQYSPSW
jgi:putative phosphoesterase